MLYTTTFRLALQIVAKDMLSVSSGLRSTFKAFMGRRSGLPASEPITQVATPRHDPRTSDAPQTILLNPTPVHGSPILARKPLPRLLLVEGAPFLRYAFAKVLRLQGFDVCEAFDAQDALERLDDFRPQILLADLSPSTEGSLEMIEQVRQRSDSDAVLIIAVIAQADDELQARAKQGGADEVVTKPVDLPTLVHRLKTMLESRT